jgi:hypothetical protein
MKKLEDDNPPTLHPTPSTALTRLATLVSHEARRLIYFHPGHNRLRALVEIVQGEVRSNWPQT